MDSNLDFLADQEEFWPDMPKSVQSKSEQDLLVDEILRLRAGGVTTRMVADFFGAPMGTIRNWVQYRALPPEWLAARLRNDLKGYPVT